MMNEYLWVEKYRPQKIEDCILSAPLEKSFKQIVKSGDIPNMLLTGSAGIGKTTVAKAICKTLDLDYIVINGSEQSGIDVLRTDIKQFASTVSLSSRDNVKVVILDEADYLNPQSTQPALRGFIEEFSDNCRFIFTCNFKNRIIAPLHSRCTVIEFNTNKKILASLCGKFMARLEHILKAENIEYDAKALAELIMKFAPDWRRIINECQQYSRVGKIDSGILNTLSDVNISKLVSYLKNKDFKNTRIWVANNIDLEPAAIFRKIYDTMSEHIDSSSIPQVVLILAEYQHKDAFVADHEINMVACLTELMASIKFK